MNKSLGFVAFLLAMSSLDARAATCSFIWYQCEPGPVVCNEPQAPYYQQCWQEQRCRAGDAIYTCDPPPPKPSCKPGAECKIAFARKQVPSLLESRAE